MNDRTDLIPILEKLGNAKVLCLGDVMLDRFVYGRVTRISPEAPIPVLHIDHEDQMLGGAGNVVRNLAALGATTQFLAVVGDDNAGQQVRRLLVDEPGVDAKLRVETGRETTIKTRFIAGTQQMLRTDRETARAAGDDIRAALCGDAEAAIPHFPVVILSDYAKGVLDDATLGRVIARARDAGTTIIVDPKGADYARYKGASLLTPNLKELATAIGRDLTGDADIVGAAEDMIKTLDLEGLLVTRSKDGMTLVTAKGAVSHFSAAAQDVFDVSGAGDTVVAALAAVLAAGGSMEQATALANVAAGIVVGKVGTAIVYADDLAAQLHHQDLGRAEAKVLSREQLIDRVAAWRQRGYRVGFTNGCFDLLHPGHVSLLAQARDACDRLIVGLNSDASVKRLKGDDRPVQNEAARAAVVASLASVDAVVLFAEDTPMELIKSVTPDVLVKGADYRLEDVVGHDVVEAAGGRVVLAELVVGHSTTATIERLAKDG